VDPAFPCSVCNFKTTSKGNLRRHLIRVHNVDRSELDNFATAGNKIRKKNLYTITFMLIQVIIWHHHIYILISTAALSVRPVLPFKCEKCERTYKTKGSLGSHKKVCGRDLSFSCAQCDYRSSEKHHLRRHLTNVHGVERSQLASYGASHGIFIAIVCCFSVVMIKLCFEFQWFVLSFLSSAKNVGAPIKTSIT